MIHLRVLFSVAACLLLAVPLVAQDAKLVERGMKVYTDQKCALCHSIGDKGNKKGPLDDVGNKYTADELRKWIVEPKEMTAKTKATRQPEMKAYPNLPKGDVEALVAYMQTLKTKK